MAISLASLKTGRDHVPPRIVIDGGPGIGKTTFACNAPGAVVIPTEDGVEPLISAGLLPAELPRFPLMTSFSEVMEGIGALYAEPHDHTTLVVDSLDWLEPLIWAACCEENKWGCIEDAGYGKGYVELDRWWVQFLTGLNALRLERSMTIILIAHSEVKRFESPDEPTYDRHQIKLHKRAHALIVEWADILACARQKILTSSETTGTGKGAKKVVKAIGEGERVLVLSERPSVVAKNRYGLPAEIPLVWEAFAEAMLEAQNR